VYKRQIKDKIRKLKGNLFVAPYGVGDHVDHLIVKEATKNLKLNKKYYLESPYLWQNFNWLKFCWKIIRGTSVLRGGGEKEIVLKKYGSQYNLLNIDNSIKCEIVLRKP
jgi:hypothetical protein